MIHLYYHGGSANHGCEAIIRSTKNILEQPITLWSSASEEDKKYGINKIITLKSDIPSPVQGVKRFLSALSHKITNNDFRFVLYSHENFFKQVKRNDVCLSIGGDNYCYKGIEKLGYYNEILNKRGAKTVLWGCSIEPSVLTKEVIKDLQKYSLITVRESYTFDALKSAGVQSNIVLCSDPAFTLEAKEVVMPEGFNCMNTVGINASPLVIAQNQVVFENYIELVRWILMNTDDRILLIPHVTAANSDDRIVLQQIASVFKENDRIKVLDDFNCQEIKGYISKCKHFIGARTHATISAYSTGVPTLVVGYSIKARGIAHDIFGCDENYVVSAQSLRKQEDLANAYCWLRKNDSIIARHLKERMPQYCKSALLGREAMMNIR